MPARVAITTNIPAPYRGDFFEYLQKNCPEYEFYIVFQAGNDSSFREWDAQVSKLKNVFFLNGNAIQSGDSKADRKEIILTKGVDAVLNEIKPDLCVIQEYNQTALMMRRYCTSRRIPYVSWTDGTEHSERNLRFYHRLARKYVISKAKAFIASSKDSADNQVRMGAVKDKVFVSELAVDIHRFEGWGNDYNPDGYLLAVGSLVERKGIDLLLRALSHLKDKDWSLHLVGSGDAEADLKGLADELGIMDRVVFRGYLQGEELIQEYENAGIYVFPTREDCFGLVTLEAMCCGVPVIASKYAGSSRDMINDGVNGYIVDPFDEKAFSERLRNLIGDKDKLMKMSIAAKAESAKYDFKETSKGYIKAIKAALMGEAVK